MARPRQPQDPIPPSGPAPGATPTGPAGGIGSPKIGGGTSMQTPSSPAAAVGTQSGTGLGGQPTFTGANGAADANNTLKDTTQTGTNTGTGNDAVTQAAGEQPAQTPIDDLEEQFTRNALGGPRDTSKDEALIQQEDQQLLGNQLYNQRASLGASGFGASGAAVGMENTTRRNMARQAAEDILGVQNQARTDAFNQGNAAINTDIANRNAANQQAILKAQADALQAILNGGDPGKPKGGAAGAAVATGATGSGLGSSVENTLDPGRGLKSDTPATAGTNTPASAPTQTTKDKLPPGAVPDGQEGNITYYKGPDGKEYYVKG